MDATLHQLGEILLRALPTFFLVVFLLFYLKAVFFKPMARVIEERYRLTEGARKMAQESLRNAERKTAEYEAAMRSARAEVYQAQEQLHKKLADQAAARSADARKSAEAMIHQAKQQLAHDVESAKQNLERDSDRMAEEIAESILRSAA